jgi:hypothetical protein
MSALASGQQIFAPIPTPAHVCWDVMNGAALDTLWREFDRRNDWGHTSV